MLCRRLDQRLRTSTWQHVSTGVNIGKDDDVDFPTHLPIPEEINGRFSQDNEFIVLRADKQQIKSIPRFSRQASLRNCVRCRTGVIARRKHHGSEEVHPVFREETRAATGERPDISSTHSKGIPGEDKSGYPSQVDETSFQVRQA